MEIDDLKKENAELRAINAKQAEQIELLQEQVAYLTAKIFGKSSEQSPENGQTSLFDDDNQGVFNQPESTGEQIRHPEVPQKKRTTQQTKITKALPIKKEVIHLAHRHCDRCGELYNVFEKQVGQKLHYQPARLYIEQKYQEVGKCRHCSLDETLDGDKLVNATMPTPFMSHSLASPDLVAQIIANKYVLALPLDRQRQLFQKMGLTIYEPTLCNWVLAAAKCLDPLNRLLLAQLKTQSHLHGDETPIQVLREPGKTASSKSYLWEVRSAEDADQPIIYFRYDPSRSEAVAKDLYVGYQGALLCDGYSGYNHLPPTVTRAGCWAHVRRKFWEAANGILSQQSIGRQAVQLIDELFQLEKQFANLSADQRLKQRQDKSRPLIDQFWRLMTQTQAIAKSKLGKAITYAFNQREPLMVFLTDGAVALSNNIAERGIKHTVIGRKNWLFSTGQAGAKANALFLGLFETAKANGIDFGNYLTYLLTRIPQLGPFPTTAQLAAYLPWHKNIQQNCLD